ncbi:MAG TPA: anaerobic ribonucleoside-triphosphate reductase activating protein [Candidatus Agathobaculum stercoravium]|nr:anaerobic ribonucleoside-triphosphate reductase activating protein [Candidatus Agathobaculum stercoravium]
MRYHNITKDDMLNGDGLRVVLWVAGCAHACPGCHNPETWDAAGGIPFDQAAKDELFAELEKDYVSGVTFSGGDPLFPANRETVGALCREIRQRFPDKTIWLYTGYRWEQIEELELIDTVDVLVDGRFEQALADTALHWRGSANQRLIDVKRTRAAHEIKLHEDK